MLVRTTKGRLVYWSPSVLSTRNTRFLLQVAVGRCPSHERPKGAIAGPKWGKNIDYIQRRCDLLRVSVHSLDISHGYDRFVI